MSEALGPAQCWCGAIYASSEDLVLHWKQVLEAGERVFDHKRPEASVSVKRKR